MCMVQTDGYHGVPRFFFHFSGFPMYLALYIDKTSVENSFFIANVRITESVTHVTFSLINKGLFRCIIHDIGSE